MVTPRQWRLIKGASSLLLLIGGLLILHKLFEEYHYHEILFGLRQIKRSQVSLAVTLTVASYFALTWYDLVSIRLAGKRLRYRSSAIVAAIAFAVSNTVGLSLLTGGALRYRFYSRLGLEVFDIARVIIFNSCLFWGGLSSMLGLALLINPLSLHNILPFPSSLSTLLGGTALTPFLLLVMYANRHLLKHRTDVGEGIFSRLGLQQIDITLPSRKLALGALAVASCDWLAASGVLYVLLPHTGDLTFSKVLILFLVGQAAGVLSHLPGGVGVFETILIIGLRDSITTPTVMGALLLYRTIYYLIPFLLAVGALVAIEARLVSVWSRVEPSLKRAQRGLEAVVPPLLAVCLFLGGVVLLVSGATPAVPSRIEWLNDIIPLFLLETSHLVGSVSGIALLLLSRGLSRRWRRAYILSEAFLVVGIVASLVKGFDFEEAALLGIVALLLFFSRASFYRKPSHPRCTSVRQLLSLWCVVFCIGWLILFSFKHVDYSHALWWQFAFESDAPRALRALLVVTVIVFALSLIALGRMAAPVPVAFDLAMRESLETIVANSIDTIGNLVFLGDKLVLMSASRESFIMYGATSTSWIALGDPLGRETEQAELLEEFCERADQADAEPIFYQVKGSGLSLYADYGFKLFKLGEEALVDLRQFSLEGSGAKEFRHTMRRFTKEGCEFRIHPASEVEALLPELRAISYEWLASKNTKEKGFSLGNFNTEYLSRFRVAAVHRQDKMLAFANIWEAPRSGELSIDLMRHREEAPNGLMDFLFINLMQHGKEQGSSTFNLGMAPLSGLVLSPISPLSARLGHYLYRHGEYFYNFDGLRRYKEKFNPVWQPRYLAYSPRAKLRRVFMDLNELISGGIVGAFLK